jgi:hypothetical protein
MQIMFDREVFKIYYFFKNFILGVAWDMPIGLMDDIYDWSMKFPERIDELEDVLTENRIWKKRLTDVGVSLKNYSKIYKEEIYLLHRIWESRFQDFRTDLKIYSLHSV